MSTLNRKLRNIYPWTWRQTPYAERGDGSSPTYSFGRESKCTRKFWIPWATNPNGSSMAIWQAAADFLGFSLIKVDSVSGKKYVSRRTPFALPGMGPERLFPATTGFPGQNYLYATEIDRIEGDRPQGNKQSLATQEVFKSMKGVIENNMSTLDGSLEDNTGLGIAQFQEAILSITFGSPRYNIMSDDTLRQLNEANGISGYNESSLLRYVEVDIQPAGKIQTFKGFSLLHFKQNLSREATPPTLTNDVPVLFSESDVAIVWRQIPAVGVPWRAIANTIGKTNDATFGTGGVAGTVNATWPRGSLVCLFPKMSMYRMINGLWAYDIQYRYKFYPNSANSFFRVNIPPVPTPDFANNFRRGVKGGVDIIFQGNVVVNGTADYIVWCTEPHGLQTGDNVTLLKEIPVVGPPAPGASNSQAYGTWRVRYIDAVRFALVNSEAGMPSGYGDSTHWILALGFYETSRSGLSGSDLLFPFADYSLLFQPE